MIRKTDNDGKIAFLGPNQNIIGIGKKKNPIDAVPPESKAATTMRIKPTAIIMKPIRKALNTVITGLNPISSLTKDFSEHSMHDQELKSKHELQTLRPQILHTYNA